MTNLRAFTYGIMVGIIMLSGTVAATSYLTGIKFQPVITVITTN